MSLNKNEQTQIHDKRQCIIYKYMYAEVVISWWSVLLLAEETGVPRENHGPAASHCQTLSHNAVSSTPGHERDSNSQLWWR
jgi:hypothetical protein